MHLVSEQVISWTRDDQNSPRRICHSGDIQDPLPYSHHAGIFPSATISRISPINRSIENSPNLSKQDSTNQPQHPGLTLLATSKIPSVDI